MTVATSSTSMPVFETPISASLLDLADGEPLEPFRLGLRRHQLALGAWLDHRPGWLMDPTIFDSLYRHVPWHGEERVMYEKTVVVPRLLAFYADAQELPHSRLVEAWVQLNDYYRPELGEDLVTAGCCLYRDGRDSVAWHGDTIGKSRTMDTVVVICSFGSERKLHLRPRGGRLTHSFTMAHGDVVVMGGSCQRTWEHAVPKTSRPVGPRISVQFRVRGVR